MEVFKKLWHEVSDQCLKIRSELTAYNITVSYIPGHKNELVDCFSRLPLLKQWEGYYPAHREEKLAREDVVLSTRAYNTATDPALRSMMKSASEDERYQEIIKVVEEGKTRKEIWALNISHPAQELAYLWPVVGILENEDGKLITIEENHIFIPPASRKEILEAIHGGHLRTANTYLLGRNQYYWMGLKEDIRKLCEGCLICIKMAPSKKDEPSVIEEAPKCPMSHMSVDPFTYEGKKFVLLMDWYSQFFCVRQFQKDPDTTRMEEWLTSVFNQFGWPLYLHSDSGPQ